MKTFLTYLTFCILLILCYVEKESARMSRVRNRMEPERRTSAGSVATDQKVVPYVVSASNPDIPARRFDERVIAGGSSE